MNQEKRPYIVPRGPIDPHCQFIWPEDKMRPVRHSVGREFGYWTIVVALFFAGTFLAIAFIEDLLK